MKDIKGKLVLVTGASSGIGSATAKMLAALGAEVILQARGIDKLNSVSAEIKAEGGIAYVYPTDLTDISATESTAQKIIEEVGVPDIIINCAGAGEWLSIFQTSNDEFHQMMDAPHFAAIRTIKAFLNYFVKRDSGHIININSAACYFIYPGAIGYLSSRWTLRVFTQALQEELRTTNIHASMLVAGKVDSPYFTNNPVSAERIPKISTMLMKTMTVEDVAKTIIKIINTKKRIIIIPWEMALSVTLNRYFPGIFRILNRMTGYRGIADEIAEIKRKS